MCVIIIPVCRRFSDLAKVIYPKRLIFAADWKTGNGICLLDQEGRKGIYLSWLRAKYFPIRSDLTYVGILSYGSHSLRLTW